MTGRVLVDDEKTLRHFHSFGLIYKKQGYAVTEAADK